MLSLQAPGLYCSSVVNPKLSYHFFTAVSRSCECTVPGWEVAHLPVLGLLGASSAAHCHMVPSGAMGLRILSRQTCLNSHPRDARHYNNPIIYQQTLKGNYGGFCFSFFYPCYLHFVSSTRCKHSFITAGAWAGIALVFCAVIRRFLFFLEEVGHQAGLADLLLLLGGLFHHAFTVFFSLWLCLQGSFGII